MKRGAPATKAELAYHYGLTHHNKAGTRSLTSASPIRKVLRWRKDEIDNAHRDIHRALGTPVEPEYGGAK